MFTFNFSPSSSYQSSRGYRVLSTEMESGVEYRYYKNRRPREWVLSFTDTVAEIDKLEAFFNARYGPYTSFNWVPPNETTAIVVRFKDESMEISGLGTKIKQATVTFREVIGTDVDYTVDIDGTSAGVSTASATGTIS